MKELAPGSKGQCRYEEILCVRSEKEGGQGQNRSWDNYGTMDKKGDGA